MGGADSDPHGSAGSRAGSHLHQEGDLEPSDITFSGSHMRRRDRKSDGQDNAGICGGLVRLQIFSFFDFPVFNVADISICVGCGLLLLDVIFLEGKRQVK